MRIFTLLILLFTTGEICQAQSKDLSPDKFESQILAYQTQHFDGTTESAFKYGSMIIGETKKAAEGDPESFNVADYFNVLSAFLSLGESDKNITLAFEKFLAAERSCDYIIDFEDAITTREKYKPILDKYFTALQNCHLEASAR